MPSGFKKKKKGERMSEEEYSSEYDKNFMR